MAALRGMQTMDNYGNVVVSAVGVVNIGFIVYAVKVVIAPMKILIDGMQKQIEKQDRSIDELFIGKNVAAERLTKIETVHRVRGCEEIRGAG